MQFKVNLIAEDTMYFRQRMWSIQVESDLKASSLLTRFIGPGDVMEATSGAKQAIVLSCSNTYEENNDQYGKIFLNIQ